jgi:hypothetical protein
MGHGSVSPSELTGGERTLRKIFWGGTIGAILCVPARFFPDPSSDPVITLDHVIFLQSFLCVLASVSAGWYVLMT